MATDPLSFPIGKFKEQTFSEAQQRLWINDIRMLPGDMEEVILNLDEAQLNTPYREGGWTLRQVVHHVADSHMNAFIRFKLGLTEDRPHIKPNQQDAWAKLPDVELVPVNISLTLLHALHTRWAELLLSLSDQDWDRTVVHPEYQKEMSLWYLLGLYAWHGRHHVAHIRSLRNRMGW